MSIDPWELTPEQAADLEARIAARKAEIATIPDTPPF